MITGQQELCIPRGSKNVASWDGKAFTGSAADSGKGMTKKITVRHTRPEEGTLGTKTSDIAHAGT